VKGGRGGQLRQQRPRAVYERVWGLRIFLLPGKQLPKNFVIWLQLTETSPQRVDRGLPGVHGGLGSLPPSRCHTVQEHRQPFQRVQVGDADAVLLNRHGVDESRNRFSLGSCEPTFAVSQISTWSRA
jgi:hypothetical protein